MVVLVFMISNPKPATVITVVIVILTPPSYKFIICENLGKIKGFLLNIVEFVI